MSELTTGITALGGSSSFGNIISNGVPNFADQEGYAIDLDPKANANNPLTNWHTENTMSWRAAPTISVDESLTWQRGTHSLNFGGGFLHVSAWENAQQFVPGIQLGFNQNNDPAAGLFVGANFPGANAPSSPRPVTWPSPSVTGQAALTPTPTSIAFALRRRRLRQHVFGVSADPAATPTLTLNATRWEVQLPSPRSTTPPAATMASARGMSGAGDGGTFSCCWTTRPLPTLPWPEHASSGTRP